jgi:hypothetical protein
VAGYEFNLFFVWLPDAETAIRRVASRAAHGGHHVADEVVRRRHERGRSNFFELYQPRADRWQVYNGVGASDGPRLLPKAVAAQQHVCTRNPFGNCSSKDLEMDAHAKPDIAAALQDREGIERACIAAARDVIKVHRMHEQPVVTWRDGETVEISVDEFECAVNRREAELNAKLAREHGASDFNTATGQ